MNRNLLIKLGAIAALIILLMIPIIMIDGMIEERQELRDGVLEDIARSSSHSQKITGPLLVVPYRKTVREWKTHDKTGERYLEESEVSGRVYFLPERLAVGGEIGTELRARGIYQARLFHSNSRLSGHFEVPANFGVTEDLADFRFGEPFVSVGISDIRGIKNNLVLEQGERKLAFQPGSADQLLGAGVHAPLPMAVADTHQAQRLEFAFDLLLQGTGELSIAPVGRETQVDLSADWPHPSFIGEYLPSEREITAKGFSARWQTSFFATNMEEALNDCANAGECNAFLGRQFGVSFVDPVDQYLKSDRALKYALLFIALTFAGFFLFEVLKRLSVHPVQYGLVGLSLAMFYLLLLSLAEHMAFAQAYALAASACVLLIGFYVSHVLHSWLRGAGFTAALAGLYAMLYALLSAEDYALLMGSLLVFGLLAAVMVLTRKLDWYGIAKPTTTLA
ncbi:cell envelope integrity protein CreD [Pseudomonas sp. SO81]|uniref:cell envelope integrity protein CreD n=1 Tax=Pseudomonas sp. SO81 TaxID=2983246 RepID=UPI0025A4C23D|nr:cell envelope integrity protein CreD [Pseudomonas sp. SO81]